MNIQNVPIGISADFRASGGKLFLPGAAEFASTLNLGQILKGKVMRQFDSGGRYLVNFEGHERVVDSSIPLTTGELIHGRVVALGDRVEMQRVHPANEEPPAAAETASADRLGKLGRHERIFEDMTGRFRAQLDVADKVVLMRAARVASDAPAMTLVGVMVNKLGFRQSPDLLWPVYRALVRENSASAGLRIGVGEDVPQLAAVTATDSNVQAHSIQQLADLLFKQMEQRAEKKDGNSAASAHLAAERNPASTPAAVAAVGRSTDQDGGSADPRRLAYRLLNIQTGGSVAHRVGTVPLLLGDQLVEVDLSFFEQHKERPGAPGVKYRKVMFSLRMERLGNVEIAASVSGTRVRLQVTTGDEESTAAVSAHVGALREAMLAGGWEIDEIVYETQQADNQNGVVRSVVDHVVSQDSLNRLI